MEGSESCPLIWANILMWPIYDLIPGTVQYCTLSDGGRLDALKCYTAPRPSYAICEVIMQLQFVGLNATIYTLIRFTNGGG